MPKICYVERRFQHASRVLINKCNTVLRQYAQAGYDMTLRQLFYQLVAAGEIPNTVKSYDNLGSLVNDARLAGLIDWKHLVDRTRNLKTLAHWDSPSEIVSAVASQYRIDKWADQPYRPEVWIEKEALAGVFERVCTQLDVPFFSCRGYTSQSEMWIAAQRLIAYNRDNHQQPVIFHFGDHDPSGIDMSRDIADRLNLFGTRMDFERLALNMNQVEEYNPPPNPAKLSDSRAGKYIDLYGDESWEIDALPPDKLAELVRGAINGIIDQRKWADSVAEEKRQRATLRAISDNFEDVNQYVDDQGWLADALAEDDNDSDEDESTDSDDE